jgi:two-component system response regulator YesN
LKKLMIIDDEFIFRQGLLYLMDWESYGYQIVGEAANGREALDMIDQVQPDLVLCDIVMPVMDGVEFMHQMHSRKKAPAVVMLSNFDEFDKVRQAFKYGAADYLLKSRVTKEELLNCFGRTAPDRRGDSGGTVRSFSALARQALDGYAAEPFEELDHYLHTHLEDPVYTILFLDKPQLDITTESELKGLLEKLLPECAVCAAFTTQNHGVAVINWPQMPVEQDVSLLLAGLKSALPHSPCALSRPLASFATFRDTTEKLYELSKYSIFHTDKLCFWEPEIVHRQNTAVFGSEMYFACVAENRWEEAKKILLDFLQKVSVPPYEFKKMIENTFHQTLRQGYSKVQDTAVLSSIELRLLKQLDRAYTFVHIEMIAEETFAALAKECGQGTADSPVIRSIKAFIEENYTEPITLNDVAAHLHLNYSYLSTYISQNSSMHFSEHLNEVRVRHAKELLSETDRSISAISEEIGYTDQSYFGKVFKKLAGITPLQYRSKARGRLNG